MKKKHFPEKKTSFGLFLGVSLVLSDRPLKVASPHISRGGNLEEMPLIRKNSKRNLFFRSFNRNFAADFVRTHIRR